MDIRNSNIPDISHNHKMSIKGSNLEGTELKNYMIDYLWYKKKFKDKFPQQIFNTVINVMGDLFDLDDEGMLNAIGCYIRMTLMEMEKDPKYKNFRAKYLAMVNNPQIHMGLFLGKPGRNEQPGEKEEEEDGKDSKKDSSGK